MSEVTFAWDFRGPRALAIAEHHARHLEEFLVRNALPGGSVRFEATTPMQAVAYLRVPEVAAPVVERTLRPPRRL